MKDIDYRRRPIRLIGLSVSNRIDPYYATGELF